MESPLGLVIEIKKNRNGKVGGKLMYEWKIDTGHFAYIPTYSDAVDTNIRENCMKDTLYKKQEMLKMNNPF